MSPAAAAAIVKYALNFSLEVKVCALALSSVVSVETGMAVSCCRLVLA